MPEVMSIEVDEEFDPRPPKQPFSFRKPDGTLNYGLIGGIAVAVVLVLLLIFVVIKPFSSDPVPPPVSTWSPTDPTKDLAFLETFAADSAMVSSVQASLDSWAEFYTTGKLEGLQDTFDLTGPQYSELAIQQPTIAAAPEAGFPSIVELGPVGEVERDGNIFTVRVENTWTKPGAPTSTTHKWDIDMKTKNNSYILVTVRDSPIGEKQPVDFCGAVEVVAGLDDTDTLSKELAKFSGQAQVDKAGEVFEVKVKAWNVLLTAVAGTDSEADVQAIVDLYQATADSSKKASSVEEMQSEVKDINVDKEREAIEERASEECSSDISNK